MIKQQFNKRLRHELQRKWKAIRSVTDWTVALYIIIPALIFAGIYYRSLWMKELSMEETIYFGLGLLAFYFVTFSRGVRSFFEQADSLFLISYPNHMRKLMKLGMYIYVNSDCNNERNCSIHYAAYTDEKYGSDNYTNRTVLDVLYCFSIYAIVVDEIHKCTCGETMGFIDYKRCYIFFKFSLFWNECIFHF